MVVHCSENHFRCSELIQQKKAKSTHCSEFNIRCSEHMHKGKDSKYSLQRDQYLLQREPKARSVQKSRSRANMVRTEQKNSQSRTVQVEHSRTGHGRPSMVRAEHTCRVDKDTVL